MTQKPGEVHVWCARLDMPPEALARLESSLGVEERRRSARFRFESDRRHFIGAHGVLRDLLGRDLGIPPNEVAYVVNSFGKPFLSPTLGGRLEFNLSHSAGLALIAIAADCCLGVDLERARTRRHDYAEIARHFFSASERDRLGSFQGRGYDDAFIRCWTRKEAYLKARGTGFTIPPSGFSVPLADAPAHPSGDPCAVSSDLDPTTLWSFYTLRPARGYIGAMAIEGTGWRVRRSRWRADPIERRPPRTGRLSARHAPSY